MIIIVHTWLHKVIKILKNAVKDDNKKYQDYKQY